LVNSVYTDATSGTSPLDTSVSFATTGAASSNTTSWNWSFPGGNPATSTQQNPMVVYDTPGTYDVSLVAGTAAGNSTFERPDFITVHPLPTAGFTSSVNGQTVQFINTSVEATAYLWDFGDGTTVSGVQPVHTYLTGGVFTVTLTAINACGSQTFSAPVTVLGPPPVAGFSSNITNQCGPGNITFTDQSTGSPTSWNWLFTGGVPTISTQQNPVIFYPGPGAFPVRLIVTNAAGADTIELNNAITIQPLPIANFAAGVNNATVSFTNASQHYQTILWNFGDGTTSTAVNPVHTYSASGTYTVRLTVGNNCGSATIEQSLQIIITGVEDLSAAWDMQVFPNPGHGYFTLAAQGLPVHQEMHLLIVNMLGQVVGQETLPIQGDHVVRSFDYAHLPSGMYTIQLVAGRQVALKKWVTE
jgi:PKD repeat protein